MKVSEIKSLLLFAQILLALEQIEQERDLTYEVTISVSQATIMK